LRQVQALELDALLHVQGDGRFARLCEFLVARLGEEAGVVQAGWLGGELIVGAVASE
jgi:hypothetical protein